jgi:hypothetical protein
MRRKLNVYTDRLHFHDISIDKGSKQLLLVWRADTEVANMDLLRVIAFRLWRPRIRVITCLIDVREWEESEQKGGEVC